MKVIFNSTGSPVTKDQFKKGVVEVPEFLKEEMKEIENTVSAGKNTRENSIRLVMGLLKDSTPSGVEVGILFPETITYAEWMLVINAAGKLGIRVYIDSEL